MSKSKSQIRIGSKRNIEDMQKFAQENGGKCLSSIYSNSYTHLLWECAAGHQWYATPNSVLNKGTWCRKCHRKQKRDLRTQNLQKIQSILNENSITGKNRSRIITINHMYKIAAIYGGLCLSSEYINTIKPLSWQCKKNA
jgi:hypothetical protein